MWLAASEFFDLRIRPLGSVPRSSSTNIEPLRGSSTLLKWRAQEHRKSLLAFLNLLVGCAYHTHAYSKLLRSSSPFPLSFAVDSQQETL